MPSKLLLCSAAILFAALPLFSQTSDEISFQRTFLLRNASGTSFNAGDTPLHPHIFTRGDWTSFFAGAAFVTFASATGPENHPNELFSTNWVSAGVQRNLGSRGLVLFRGRASLEPLTIKEEGYPQLLQYVSAENGGPLLDHMRAQDLLQEAAVDVAFRVTTASFVHLYAAPVGDPAFGAVPFEQRASSEEFAEAPFAYDIQETIHDSTSVVTAGFGSRWVTVEGSVFHDAVTTGNHTTIDNGDIDSSSARVVITPFNALSLQVSRAKLGDDDRQVDSASLTIGSHAGAFSAIYTKRDDDLVAGGIEGIIRIARSTLAARIESVDRPRGFLGHPEVWRTTHFTVGYTFDIIRSSYLVGVGANVDYQTQYRDLPDRYGHKPQTLYAFVRFRTDSMRRP